MRSFIASYFSCRLESIRKTIIGLRLVLTFTYLTPTWLTGIFSYSNLPKNFSKNSIPFPLVCLPFSLPKTLFHAVFDLVVLLLPSNIRRVRSVNPNHLHRPSVSCLRSWHVFPLFLKTSFPKNSISQNRSRFFRSRSGRE